MLIFLVSDSAAGATAFSCGLKTFNGAIGVTPALAPCGTLLEAAHRQGFATGLVATSRITHATPASFYAHVPDRDLESEIAAFLIGEAGTGLAGPAPVDFAFGGGRCFFVPQGEDGSCRTDETDLLKKAREKGFRVLEGMAALRDFKEEDEDDREGTIIGLFADDVRLVWLTPAQKNVTDSFDSAAYGLRNRPAGRDDPRSGAAEPA